MKLKRELKKFASCCAYCGKDLIKYSDKTIDHIVPLSKGGKGRLSNIVCACESCNNLKSDTDLKDWFSQNMDRKAWLMVYLLKMRNFKENYMELIFKKVGKVTK